MVFKRVSNVYFTPRGVPTPFQPRPNGDPTPSQQRTEPKADLAQTLLPYIGIFMCLILKKPDRINFLI